MRTPFVDAEVVSRQYVPAVLCHMNIYIRVNRMDSAFSYTEESVRLLYRLENNVSKN